jgi:hypothetical protein
MIRYDSFSEISRDELDGAHEDCKATSTSLDLEVERGRGNYKQKRKLG